jgi:hypothetical protein
MLPKLQGFGPGLPLLILRTIYELARARIKLARLETREIARLNEAAIQAARGPGDSPVDAGYVARIARVVPRLARIVPWRSDCLVQALAAQRLLAARGIAGTIVIGARMETTSGFAPHAWLKCGELAVTGGEVEDYTVLYGNC